MIARSLLPALAEIDDNAQRWRVVIAFWVRRIWRLFPAASFWLAVIVLASIFFNASGSFGSIRSAWTSAIAGVFQVANFRLLACYDSFDCGPAFAWWSLSLEEQFYLILPVIAIFSGRWLVPVLCVIVFSQLFIGPLYMPRPLSFDGLFLGVLIAIWSQHHTHTLFQPRALEKSVFGLIIFLILLVGLASMVSYDHQVLPTHQGEKVIILIAAVLVILASYNQNYLCSVPVLKPLLLWIGSRSYGIYLIHIPGFYGARELWFRISGPQLLSTEEGVYPLLLTAVIVIIIFSELSYRLIEAPLRRKGRSIAQNIQAAP